MNDKYYVYILKCSDDSFYTGITNDLEKRLKCHNDGKASKYTRARLPVEIVYIEETQGRGPAQSREYVLRNLKRQEKIKLIDNFRETKNLEDWILLGLFLSISQFNLIFFVSNFFCFSFFLMGSFK